MPSINDILLPSFAKAFSESFNLTAAEYLRMTSRIILVTEANRGIGFRIAQALVQKNARDTIIVTARAQAAASEAIQQLKEEGAQNLLDSTALDVTNDESIHALVSRIQNRYGRLDGMLPCSDEMS